MTIVVGYVCCEETHEPIERAPSRNLAVILTILGDELNLGVSYFQNAPLRDRGATQVSRCVSEEMWLRGNLVEQDDPTSMALTIVSPRQQPSKIPLI